MGFGVSLFLVAVGAILTLAVNAEVENINLDTAGIILMIIGGIGFLWSIFALWGDDVTQRRYLRDRERDL